MFEVWLWRIFKLIDRRAITGRMELMNGIDDDAQQEESYNLESLFKTKRRCRSRRQLMQKKLRKAFAVGFETGSNEVPRLLLS